MEKDDLSYLLVSAIEETEEDKEIEKQAVNTFVDADPEDYYEDEDLEDYYYEDEENDEERHGIETDVYNTFYDARQTMLRIQRNIATRTDEQLPSLPIDIFSELNHLLSETKSKTTITKDLACDYTVL